MEKYLEIIKTNSLFSNFSDKEILDIIPCVEGQTHRFRGGEMLVLEGDSISKIGIVLEGELSITEIDIDGNLRLISKLKPGDTFGEAFAISGKPSKVSIRSDSAGTVLFLAYNKIISACSSACEFHKRLISNLVRTLAGKLVYMQAKLDILHKHNIRSRLDSYFERCALEKGGRSFDLPLNRSELAEYIGVNRSAMHRELKKMQEEGLIELAGNKLSLL